MASRRRLPANGLHPSLLDELSKQYSTSGSSKLKKNTGSSRNRSHAQPPTSTRMFGRKRPAHRRHLPANDCIALPRVLNNTRGAEKHGSSVTSPATREADRETQKSAPSGTDKFDVERVARYPDRVLSDNEYNSILQEMRAFIAEAPTTNSGWGALVGKFQIGYLQAKKMCVEILRAAPPATSSNNIVDASGSRISHATEYRTTGSSVRKRARETGVWLTDAETEEIKCLMKPLLLPHAFDSSSVDYTDLAVRFDLSEDQAVEIANDLLFNIRSEPSLEHQNRVKEQKLQERRIQSYPKRIMSYEDHREIKRAMRRLPFDEIDAELGDNKWIDFADKNRINHMQLMELRREIKTEGLRPPSGMSDDDRDDSFSGIANSRASLTTPSMYSASSDRKPSTQAESVVSDTKLMDAERHRADIAARNVHLRRISKLMFKVEQLYQRELSSDAIAHKLKMPPKFIQDLVLQYLCHLVHARFAAKKLSTTSLNPWTLDVGRIKQVENAVKRLPYSNIRQIAEATNLNIGAVRAILLHKLRLWRDGAYADLLDDAVAVEKTVDMSTVAVSSSRKWRAATVEEIRKNGFVGFNDNNVDAVSTPPRESDDDDDDDEAVAMLSSNTSSDDSPPQVRPKMMRTSGGNTDGFSSTRSRHASSSYQSNFSSSS